jgi:hypothetical protein
MVTNLSCKKDEQKQNVQSDKHVCTAINVIFEDKCAICLDKSPEYILEDNQLCGDCYEAEVNYWAKGIHR